MQQVKKDGYKYLTACIAFAIVRTDTGVVSHFEGVQMVDFQRYREVSLQEMLKTGGSAHGGLTVRDYFAAMAMQGLVTASGDQGSVDYDDAIVSENAYSLADSMLAQREKSNG